MKDREIRSQDTMPWSISSRKAVRVKASISPKLWETKACLYRMTGFNFNVTQVDSMKKNSDMGVQNTAVCAYWVPLSTRRARVPMPSILINSVAKVGSADSLASSFRASRRASIPCDWILSRSWRAARAWKKTNHKQCDNLTNELAQYSKLDACKTLQGNVQVSSMMCINTVQLESWRVKHYGQRNSYIKHKRLHGRES